LTFSLLNENLNNAVIEILVGLGRFERKDMTSPLFISDWGAL